MFGKSTIILLRPFVTSETTITPLLVFIFHVIPYKLKTSEDLNIWKLSLSFPAKIKIEVPLCSQGTKKKKSMHLVLGAVSKMGSYKISLCRGHTKRANEVDKKPRDKHLHLVSLRKDSPCQKQPVRRGVLTHFLLWMCWRKCCQERKGTLSQNTSSTKHFFFNFCRNEDDFFFVWIDSRYFSSQNISLSMS